MPKIIRETQRHTNTHTLNIVVGDIAQRNKSEACACGYSERKFVSCAVFVERLLVPQSIQHSYNVQQNISQLNCVCCLVREPGFQCVQKKKMKNKII